MVSQNPKKNVSVANYSAVSNSETESDWVTGPENITTSDWDVVARDDASTRAVKSPHPSTPEKDELTEAGRLSSSGDAESFSMVKISAVGFGGNKNDQKSKLEQLKRKGSKFVKAKFKLAKELGNKILKDC